MKISYAIPVCNEITEIQRLLGFLIENKRVEDEIIVLYDVKNGAIEVEEYLREASSEGEFIWHRYAFDGHFSDMKNELKSLCNGDYIFQIDADEMITEILISNLPTILGNNPNNEVYLIPRVNTVSGLTQEHITRWGWNVDEQGKVNWPDYQWRIWENKPEIKWVNKVHEKLEGFKTYAPLPQNPELALQHPKTIERQEKQNIYYDEIEMKTVKGAERDKNYYNDVFSRAELYHSDFDKMKGHGQNWAKIWKSSVPMLKEHNVKSILDIGSGMGQFGQLVQSLNIQYKGIDFSEYAVNYAKNNTLGNEVYECVDAFEYNFDDEVDCYVSHEFLEHIEGDTTILSKLKPGKLIIFSVPSFDDKGHVRMFKNENMIINRYSPYIKDLKVIRITPAIHFLGWGITK
jgi:2-polyprenyl-3-methyl-5-hydroxy-6-metoxy-1,4-benzoquinol methylase